MTFAEVLDYCRFHTELDQVEGNEPDDILIKRIVSESVTWSGLTKPVTHPNPNNADPSSRYLLDVGETPISEAGDDRGYELRQKEGTHQCIRGTLHKEEPVGASNENERLRDNGNLEVDDRVKLLVIVVNLTRRGVEVDMELPLEEVRL